MTRTSKPDTKITSLPGLGSVSVSSLAPPDITQHTPCVTQWRRQPREAWTPYMNLPRQLYPIPISSTSWLAVLPRQGENKPSLIAFENICMIIVFRWQLLHRSCCQRGWTAFSIAMTDRRVIAIAPMVFSLIHMEESTMAHYKAMGGAWTFALEPYWRENLTQLMLEPIAYMPGGIYDFEDVYR